MFTGKAWPKALRGLRMVAVALLEPFIPSGVNSVEDFEKRTQFHLLMMMTQMLSRSV